MNVVDGVRQSGADGYLKPRPTGPTSPSELALTPAD